MTIDARDATVGEIVEEFRRQAGMTVVVKRPMKLDVLRLAFVVEDQPVPSAMESFARAAGLECEWLGPTSVSLRPVQRVTFGFKDADVRRILEVIITVSGASFIVSPDVRGTVTMSVDNAPWMDVLTALARTAGLVIVREDSGILRILKE